MSDSPTSNKSVYDHDPALETLPQIKARDARDYTEHYTNPWAKCAMEDRHWLLQRVAELDLENDSLKQTLARITDEPKATPSPAAEALLEAYDAAWIEDERVAMSFSETVPRGKAKEMRERFNQARAAVLAAMHPQPPTVADKAEGSEVCRFCYFTPSKCICGHEPTTAEPAAYRVDWSGKHVDAFGFVSPGGLRMYVRELHDEGMSNIRETPLYRRPQPADEHTLDCIGFESYGATNGVTLEVPTDWRLSIGEKWIVRRAPPTKPATHVPACPICKRDDCRLTYEDCHKRTHETSGAQEQ